MNYSRTKIMLFIWAAIFTITTSFLVFGYLKLQKIEEYTKKLEQENAQQAESARSFESLTKTTSSIKEDSEKANSYFIKRDEVVKLLDTIEALGTTTKTQILIQSVTDKKNASSSALLVVGLRAVGSYTSLYHLIKLLEELPYQSEIQSIRIIKGASSWSADISLISIMF